MASRVRGRGGVRVAVRGRGRGGAGGRGKARGEGDTQSGAGADLPCSFCRTIRSTECSQDCIYRGIMSPATDELDEDAVILSRYFRDEDIRNFLEARSNFTSAQKDKFLRTLLVLAKLLNQWKDDGPYEWIEEALKGILQAAERIGRAVRGGGGGSVPGGDGGPAPRGGGGGPTVQEVGGDLVRSSVGSAVGVAIDGPALVGAGLDSSNASVVGGGGNVVGGGGGGGSGGGDSESVIGPAVDSSRASASGGGFGGSDGGSVIGPADV